jgi:hypothetical protein
MRGMTIAGAARSRGTRGLHRRHETQVEVPYLPAGEKSRHATDDLIQKIK